MLERLQKFLAGAGVASRRTAEQLILAGRVQVNGQVVRQLGTKVDPAVDRVRIDGSEVRPTTEHHYYLLYKPEGVITTLKDPQGRPTVGGFTAKLAGRVYPVGRLDYDAEGALLLTDDGELAHRLTHPRFEVPRTYLAKVKGEPTPESLAKLAGGVRLEDGMATPRSVEIFERAPANTWLAITVGEGRPHIIKRMCAAIGHPVVRLFRPAHGGIGLGALRPGEVRALTAEEVERVQQVSRGAPTPSEPLKLPPRRHGRPGARSPAPGAPGDDPETDG